MLEVGTKMRATAVRNDATHTQKQKAVFRDSVEGWQQKDQRPHTLQSKKDDFRVLIFIAWFQKWLGSEYLLLAHTIQRVDFFITRLFLNFF